MPLWGIHTNYSLALSRALYGYCRLPLCEKYHPECRVFVTAPKGGGLRVIFKVEHSLPPRCQGLGVGLRHTTLWSALPMETVHKHACDGTPYGMGGQHQGSMMWGVFDGRPQDPCGWHPPQITGGP
jgi:hypothetical protein